MQRSSEFPRDDDAPELTESLLSRSQGHWRIGDRVVTPSVGRTAMRRALTGKTRVNSYFDTDIIVHFKRKAGGRGYQTLMNAALREHIEGATKSDGTQDLVTIIRNVIRDEIRAAVATTPVPSSELTAFNIQTVKDTSVTAH